VRCLGRATARDDNGEGQRRRGCETHGNEEKKNCGFARPTAGKTRKKKKNNLRPTADKMARPLPPSFFFLFSFFLVENLVLLGVEFFCVFFSY
jgi:hypothetical protein